MTGRRRSTGRRSGREGIVHHNLMLVRAADAEQLERLLARADLRNRCVRRLGADAALFQRSALPLLRRRLDELDLPVVVPSGEPTQDESCGP